MEEIILKSENGKILTSSRDVAEIFNKQHKHIMRDIRELQKDVSKSRPMFTLSEYKDSYGRKQNEYLMDRDGFSLLAMGFTGKSALQWKIKYIEAFNKMEEKLKSGNVLGEEEKLKLQLFSKDPGEVASAHNKLVELATAPLQKTIEMQKPKAEFYDSIAVAENSVNFGEFAAILQNNNNIKMGRNKIMDWCRKMDYLCSSHSLRNKPTQRMLNSGYMQYKENINEQNGKQYITYTPMLTGKGQVWLVKELSDCFSR